MVTNERRDDDSAWKNLIEHFFYDAIRRCIPALYEAADKSKRPVFLDKELRKITGRHVNEEAGVADFLVSVPLASGDDEWIMLHAEQQGSGGGDLPFRMFRYMALIFARYGKNITALAIITDKRKRGEPDYYSYSLFGTEYVYKYNRVVVADLDEAELLESDNPFDLALFAGQLALRGKRSESTRFAYMKELLRLLHQRGWSREEKLSLFVFIDAVLNIRTPELIEDLSNYESNLEKGDDIMLVSHIEQRGFDKGVEKGVEIGIKQGMEKGSSLKALEMAQKLLLNGISPDVIAESSGLSLEEVERLRIGTH